MARVPERWWKSCALDPGFPRRCARPGSLRGSPRPRSRVFLPLLSFLEDRESQLRVAGPNTVVAPPTLPTAALLMRYDQSGLGQRRRIIGREREIRSRRHRIGAGGGKGCGACGALRKESGHGRVIRGSQPIRDQHGSNSIEDSPRSEPTDSRMCPASPWRPSPRSRRNRWRCRGWRCRRCCRCCRRRSGGGELRRWRSWRGAPVWR